MTTPGFATSNHGLPHVVQVADGYRADRMRDEPSYAPRVAAIETRLRTAAFELATLAGPAHAWRCCYTAADQIIERAGAGA